MYGVYILGGLQSDVFNVQLYGFFGVTLWLFRRF
jgi:hypothetical protein